MRGRIWDPPFSIILLADKLDNGVHFWQSCQGKTCGRHRLIVHMLDSKTEH